MLIERRAEIFGSTGREDVGAFERMAGWIQPALIVEIVPQLKDAPRARFWNKLLSSVLGICYDAVGKLPSIFLTVLFFADIIYLPPIYVILRRLSAMAAEGDALLAAIETQWNDKSLRG